MTHDPRALNAIAAQLAEDFGDPDGFLPLSKRYAGAQRVLEALHRAGFAVTAGPEPADQPIEHVPTRAGLQYLAIRRRQNPRRGPQ